MRKREIKKTIIYALKIAIGSCAAIFLANIWKLDFAESAGSIALLTLVTTKWETLKLSIFRIFTFLISVELCAILFTQIRSEWIGYGLFIFIMAVFCTLIGWKSTISVNAVIGTHFLMTRDFSVDAVNNELKLVLIGITVAVIINLFHNNSSHRKELIQNMEYTEQHLQMALGEMAAYLSAHEMERNVWDDVIDLEKRVQYFIEEAYRYQNNTFQSHTSFYIQYFEMRLKQCAVLHNLHYEVKKIRNMPKQATIIANYIMYMVDYVGDLQKPEEQIQKMQELFDALKEEPLPETRDEFESRAILYHIMMDLEEFLVYKRRFVEALRPEQIRKCMK